jgi:hypothetical protein
MDFAKISFGLPARQVPKIMAPAGRRPVKRPAGTAGGDSFPSLLVDLRLFVIMFKK